MMMQSSRVMSDDDHDAVVYYDTSSSKLRDSALARSTLRTYNNNVNKFLTFTRLSSSQLIALPHNIIDQRVSQYIDTLYADHGSFDYACQTVFGLIHRHPALRHSLGESRLRLRGWKRLKAELARSHPPITWEMTVVFATTMARWGRHAEAVATLLSFDCFLRVTEMTSIKYHDIVLPNDPRLGSAYTGMVVRLAKAKTGLNQSVSVGRPQVQAALHQYLLSYPFLAGHRVFPFQASSFRTLIHQVAASLGLSDIPYVPHSFRHGGATDHFLRGATIEQIMYRGRWAALESTRRYIQTSRALLIVLHIPASLHQAGLVLERHIDAVLAHLRRTVPSARRDKRVWFRLAH